MNSQDLYYLLNYIKLQFNINCGIAIKLEQDNNCGIVIKLNYNLILIYSPLFLKLSQFKTKMQSRLLFLICAASAMTVEALPIEKRGLMGDIGSAIFASIKSIIYAKIFGTPAG